jgi:hypothetical protein
MSSVVLSGNTSGAVTLSVPDVAGTNTATLPAATGTVMVSGNMPAFAAYKSSGAGAQNPTTNVNTKVTFDTEVFDTANCYSGSTFTPNVAGYYQINASVDCGANSSTLTNASINLVKNGSIYNWSYMYVTSPQGNDLSAQMHTLVYCNGTTDYIDIYVTTTGTNPVIYAGQTTTWVNGYLVRAA